MGGRLVRGRRARVMDLREAVLVAVESLEDERMHPATRVQLALGVLRSALLRFGRRDPRSRTRCTD